jgi:TonB family protein
VYSLGDEGVTLPVPVSQRLPDMSQELLTIVRARQGSGLLDVLIDENGTVLEATIRRSLHPKFDALVVEAARRWKYRPAMKGGVAVRFVKTISLVLP